LTAIVVDLGDEILLMPIAKPHFFKDVVGVLL
jgi:hypothetical protein